MTTNEPPAHPTICGAPFQLHASCSSLPYPAAGSQQPVLLPLNPKPCVQPHPPAWLHPIACCPWCRCAASHASCCGRRHMRPPPSSPSHRLASNPALHSWHYPQPRPRPPPHPSRLRAAHRGDARHPRRAQLHQPSRRPTLHQLSRRPTLERASAPLAAAPDWHEGLYVAASTSAASMAPAAAAPAARVWPAPGPTASRGCAAECC
jgi:hypothetical protein